MRKFATFSLLYLCTLFSFSQSTQNIRGKIIDKQTKEALPGANVLVVESNPAIGATSSQNGYFQLLEVPLGRQSLAVSYIGYKSKFIENLIITSAKEIVLEVELEEDAFLFEEVVVKANKMQGEIINKMASVSARTFSVEETEKYAGSRGDVARMAMNFAGVASNNDSRNDIIIRGNSPAGLLWKLEDVVIPNPNHFAENGTTGGPVGMLNNNLLSNSDFMTTAFPAEYGNALSGVFDLNLRNGNYENHEFLFQVGFNGFEIGAEGPLQRKKRSSYLVNARYSTLELVSKFIDLGTTGVPKYKDISYKLNFPLKNGNLSLFALGGDSQISMLDSKNKESQEDLYSGSDMDLVNFSSMITQAVSYTHQLKNKNYIKLMFSGVYQKGGTTIDTLDEQRQPHQNIEHNFKDYKINVSAYVNQKINKRFFMRHGFGYDWLGFNLDTRIFDKDLQRMKIALQDNKGLGQNIFLLQFYSQNRWLMSPKLSLNSGLHFQYFRLSSSFAAEPRLGLEWQPKAGHRINFGYGMHSKSQITSTYFYRTYAPDGSYTETNKKLDLTKAHHLVLGHEWRVSEFTRLKNEFYYQYLYNVPVTERLSSYSMLNMGEIWGIIAEDSLVNRGVGENYGVELTLERFFHRNVYYLATLSLFDSKYQGSDGIRRNARFNGKYILNVLGGKEWKVGRFSVFNVDVKITFAGGKRYTPVDLEASRIENETVWDESRAFAKQFKPFFKTDVKFGYRLNGKKVSQKWLFYIENVINHKNQFMQVYDKDNNSIRTIYQLGFSPMFEYKILF